jgi:CRISPR-associated endonuclease/helicase Cas3
MDYPVSRKDAGRDDTLLNLLSSNAFNANSFKRESGLSPSLPLLQAFMTAGDLFKSIDAPTESVIVPYGKEGDNIINQLCAAFDVEKQYGLLREAQQYSVNIYPKDLEALKKKKAIMKIQENTEIYYINKTYYSDEFGISLESLGKEGLANV